MQVEFGQLFQLLVCEFVHLGVRGGGVGPVFRMTLQGHQPGIMIDTFWMKLWGVLF